MHPAFSCSKTPLVHKSVSLSTISRVRRRAGGDVVLGDLNEPEEMGGGGGEGGEGLARTVTVHQRSGTSHLASVL